MPFFSVVVPLFNKAAHIENTLESVLGQTFSDFEIIVVNDGSTDNGVEKVLDFKDNRIRMYHQENAGVSVARNLGILKSEGELIAFLDADDYWFPDHLEALANLYRDFPDCGMYCSRYIVKTSAGHFQIPKFNGISLNYRGIIENYFYSNRPFRITWTSSLAIPKNILEKFEGFTQGVTNGQDLELWTKIGIQHPVALTDQVTAIYNFDIAGSLAKRKVTSMTLMDFRQFHAEEKHNPDLASFLDLHRFFYAILHKTYGSKATALQYYNAIDKKNISMLNRLLFHFPAPVLKLLYGIKRTLKKARFEFSTYN